MTDHEPYRGVLIYDGDCPFCSAASTALRQLDDIGAIQHEHEAATAFLEAQFGEAPFALFFVDIIDGQVWAGEAAASELCERAGMPGLVGDIVGDNYERIAGTIRSVTGVEREPDPYHGVYQVTAEAAELYETLESHARRTRSGDVSESRPLFGRRIAGKRARQSSGSVSEESVSDGDTAERGSEQ